MPQDKPDSPITIIGISEFGWNGLDSLAKDHINQAAVILGGQRQLDLLPHHISMDKTLQAWPSPLMPFLKDFAKNRQQCTSDQPKTCILASGNPMLYGIGASLSRLLPPDMLTVLPQPSVQSMVCARMLWPQQDTTLISLCGRPLSQLNTALFDQGRLILLSADSKTPAKVAAYLQKHHFPESEMTIFENMAGGHGHERRHNFTAQNFQPEAIVSDLNAIAVHLERNTKTSILSKSFGLPDDAFHNDGQITKREIRAMTLAALSPRPDEVLWDIGGGSGSISIEWMRAAPRAAAYTIEQNTERARNIILNAQSLGTPALKVITGKAPGAVADLPAPDAIFIGGGLGQTGLLSLCLKELKPGGRLVINAVTLQSETILYNAYQEHGGSLTQIQISKPDKIGRFDSWQPARPVTQWVFQNPWKEKTL